MRTGRRYRGSISRRVSRLLAAVAVTLALPFVASCGNGASPTFPGQSSDPSQALFVTSDVPRFWAAYDAGGDRGASAPFQTGYLDQASAGLLDFIRLRNVTASSLASMVRVYPRYFADIRVNTMRLATDTSLQARMRAGYRRIKDLYPDAIFPPVTFVIGRFSTAGTTSSSGMLIGLEFFGIGPATPLEELTQFHRDNVRPLDSLPAVVAHEHTHILQARAGGVFTHSNKTLLEQALMEGSADFIGELASGSNINGRLRAYAIPREAALWQEFRSVMNGTDVSRWLYNQGGPGSSTADRPGDLGYFIGYRIVESYYARIADKRAAVRGIIEMQDAALFLAASGYAPVP